MRSTAAATAESISHRATPGARALQSHGHAATRSWAPRPGASTIRANVWPRAARRSALLGPRLRGVETAGCVDCDAHRALRIVLSSIGFSTVGGSTVEWVAGWVFTCRRHVERGTRRRREANHQRPTCVDSAPLSFPNPCSMRLSLHESGSSSSMRPRRFKTCESFGRAGLFLAIY